MQFSIFLFAFNNSQIGFPDNKMADGNVQKVLIFIFSL